MGRVGWWRHQAVLAPLSIVVMRQWATQGPKNAALAAQPPHQAAHPQCIASTPHQVGAVALSIVLAYLMDPGASTSEEGLCGGPPRVEDALEYLQEQGEEQIMAQWKGSQGWGDFPDHMIPCPLPAGPLSGYYSMDVVPPEVDTATYQGQMEALEEYMRNPPANKTAKDGSSAAYMAAYSEETIINRLRCLCEFLGFCFHHLGVQPTLESVFKPQLVAKYWGFLKARGLKASAWAAALGCEVVLMLYMLGWDAI